jgi:glycosyltransferase involved in cell wall biosynthesis
LGNSTFTFLNIGTLTSNKGLIVLLKAFAVVLQRHPDVWLLLKGVDALYRSQDMLNEHCKLLTADEARRIVPRIKYIGQNLSADDMAGLYQATDAYVTPYFAEGFNLPALEAIATGLPLICTAGGPTDDFVNDDVALRINSKPIAVPSGVYVGGTALEPNLHHLIELMNRVIEDPSIAQRARSRGPEHVAANFTWRNAVLRLMEILFAG